MKIEMVDIYLFTATGQVYFKTTANFLFYV